MKKYKSIEVLESKLEDLIRQAPELIEAGLIFIDHQIQTNRGPLDVLMKDSGNALVIAEIKVIEDDGILFQGIDYYDYLARNLDGYARAYKKFEIDVNQEPRLFLIAPTFSANLLNRIKWINIPISLFSYQCIEFDETPIELVPIYREISVPGLPSRIESYSLEDRYNYITDSTNQEFAEKFVAEIKSWDSKCIQVNAIKYAISIKFSGRVLAYIEPRREYFYVSLWEEENNWTNHKFNSKDDYEPIMTIVKTCFERLNSG